MGKYLADSYDAALRENANLAARLAELELALSEAHRALRDKCERLAEAEALLRENCGQIPQPLGWFERVRMFLGITDSASACAHWWTLAPNPSDIECKVCGMKKADQPSSASAQRGSLAGWCKCGSDGSPYAPCVCGGQCAADQPGEVGK